MAINKVIYGGETLIDLTGDTVDASHLLAGYTAHDKSGAVITGTNTFDSDTSDYRRNRSRMPWTPRIEHDLVNVCLKMCTL